MGVLIFSIILVQKFLILRRNIRESVRMYIDIHVQYQLFLPDCDQIWIDET
jgi:hypothetical protein